MDRATWIVIGVSAVANSDAHPRIAMDPKRHQPTRLFVIAIHNAPFTIHDSLSTAVPHLPRCFLHLAEDAQQVAAKNLIKIGGTVAALSQRF